MHQVFIQHKLDAQRLSEEKTLLFHDLVAKLHLSRCTRQDI